MITRSKAMAEIKNFNLNIQSFSGEQESVSWFLDQVCQMKTLFSWSDEVALLFLKGKLSGVAKEFVATNPKFSNANFDNTCKYLKDFFESDSNPTTNLLALNQLHLLPGETIKNFAHRIESMVAKTYTSVTDSKALNQIKSLQLINGLPQNLKEILIVEDSTNDFNKLVAKANKFVVAKTTLQVLESNHIFSPPADKAENVNQLQAQIDKLTLKMSEIKCQFCNQNHSLAQCQLFKDTLNPKPESKVINNVNRVEKSNEQSDMCHFCNKNGHIMAQCRTYLATLRQEFQSVYQDQPQFVTPRFPHYNYEPPRYQNQRFPNTSYNHQNRSRQHRPNFQPRYGQNFQQRRPNSQQTKPKEPAYDLNWNRGY